MGGNETSACRFGIRSGQQGQDIWLPYDIQRRGVEADNASQAAPRQYHQRVCYETGL